MTKRPSNEAGSKVQFSVTGTAVYKTGSHEEKQISGKLIISTGTGLNEEPLAEFPVTSVSIAVGDKCFTGSGKLLYTADDVILSLEGDSGSGWKTWEFNNEQRMPNNELFSSKVFDEHFRCDGPNDISVSNFKLTGTG